jgi:hypothetical protein
MPDDESHYEESREINLDTHPLVNKLHPNPDEIPDIVALVGYLGPSRKDDCVRLYSDLTFRNYYEIPTSGILATSQTNAGDENSPTSVHVSADTRLEAVSISSQNIEASYLKGSIASSHLGSASAPAQAVAGFPTQTMWNCGTANTITCNYLGAGGQAGQPAAQAANVGTGNTWDCLITRINCGDAGVQAGAHPAAQAVTAGWPNTLGCTTFCTGFNCQGGGVQAGAHPGQAVAGFPTQTLVNCGTAYTLGCNNLGAMAQAGHPAAQAANAARAFTDTCWCTLVGGPCT